MALARNREFFLAKIAQRCMKEHAEELAQCLAMNSCLVDILVEVLVELAMEVFCMKNARERAEGL